MRDYLKTLAYGLLPFVLMAATIGLAHIYYNYLPQVWLEAIGMGVTIIAYSAFVTLLLTVSGYFVRYFLGHFDGEMARLDEQENHR